MSEHASRKAELRSRWQAALEAGALASLGSEGRLVALYVFLKADWSTCVVRLSMRKAAKAIGVQPTTIRRGVAQMISAGILRGLGKAEGTVLTAFQVERCARAVRTPDTPCAHPRAQGVRTPDTQCAQRAHEACAPRTRVVRSARTRCAHDSVLASGIPVNTSGDTSAASPPAGQGPAGACLPEIEEGAA